MNYIRTLQHSTVLHCTSIRLSEYWADVSLYSTVLHRITYTILHCTTLYSTVLHRITYNLTHCTTLYSIALNSPSLYCTVHLGTALYCRLFRCTALHCTALHCTAQHCTVSYTALHCTVSYTALHCTVSYTALQTARHWTIIRYSAVKCRARSPWTVLYRQCTTLLHWMNYTVHCCNV